MNNKKAAPKGAALNQSLVALGKGNGSTLVQSSKFGWNVTYNGELIASFLTQRKAICFVDRYIQP